MLATLYAASSLPYPSNFRDTFLGTFNGTPIPWHVDCLKQGASWTFADSFILRASILAVTVLLIPVDAFLIRETGDSDTDPDYAGSTGGKLSTRIPYCIDLSYEWRRWFVNTQQGTAEGYDHSLYSSLYLKYAADNFLVFALMTFVPATQPHEGALFYDTRLTLADSGRPYQAFSIFFIVFYVAAGVWFFALPVFASFAGETWASKCILKRRAPRVYPLGIAPPPLIPASDKVLGFFNLAQLCVTFFTSFAVLVPTNNRAMTGTLLVIALLELLVYLRQLLHFGLTKPFSLTGEVVLYLFQLLLAVLTHSVAVNCAAQGCKADSPQWQTVGLTLMVLHSIFLVSFSLYLARLVLCNHSPPECTQCTGNQQPPPVQCCNPFLGCAKQKRPLQSAAPVRVSMRQNFTGVGPTGRQAWA